MAAVPGRVFLAGIAAVRSLPALFPSWTVPALSVGECCAEPPNLLDVRLVFSGDSSLSDIPEPHFLPPRLEVQLDPLPFELAGRVVLVGKGWVLQRLLRALPDPCVVANQHLEPAGIRTQARPAEVAAVDAAAVRLVAGAQPRLRAHDREVGRALRAPAMVVAEVAVVAVSAVHTLEDPVLPRVALEPGALFDGLRADVGADAELEPHFAGRYKAQPQRHL
mmetsp:Transcript_23510/g.56070  ORF Transcript_23510/g.56070 Transcript_23510/m.56070 type:complete len:221 (-) Transcript_23510:733-1395(-)